MQTLSVHFLKEEMPEIREVVSKMDNVEILMEQDVPGSSTLIEITMFLPDPSVLYTMGLLVGLAKMEKKYNEIYKPKK